MKKILLGLSVCLSSLLHAGFFTVVSISNLRNEKVSLRVFDHDQSSFVFESDVDSCVRDVPMNLEINLDKQTLYLNGLPEELPVDFRQGTLQVADIGVVFESL